MPVIQRPDLVAKIRKKYELTGPDAISTISPELVPVVVLEDLAESDPGDARKFCTGYASTGVPVNTGHVELWNPADSGVNVKVTRASCWLSAGGSFYVTFHSAALSTPSGVRINTNLGQSGDPAALTLSEDNAVPLGAVIGYYVYNAGAASSDIVQRPILLQPGQGLGMRAVTAATNVNANFLWEEVSV